MDPNARYCPQGHHLSRTLLSQRQRLIREEHQGAHRLIVCNACGDSIQEEYIAGSCKNCDIDFCETCFTSGRSVDELLQQGSISRPVMQACCMVAITQSADPLTAAARGERYNGRRPSQGRRVSYTDYPDPTNYQVWSDLGKQNCCQTWKNKSNEMHTAFFMNRSNGNFPSPIVCYWNNRAPNLL